MDASLVDFAPHRVHAPGLAEIDIGEAFLVGVGAIGNAAVWALARTPGLRGHLHLVDGERLDISNVQRYVLTACEGLGAEYGAVGAAIRAELRALLAAFPELPEMTLMDDTPAANAQTQAWLRAEALHPAPADGEPSAAPGAGGNGNGAEPSRVGARSHGPLERALAELRAGRPERAIELLMRELAHERTPRRQFILKTQVARIMVEAGLEAIALPILRELLERIDAHKLEDWEAGDMVAQPMVLLCRCIDKLKGDQNQRQALYLRICRLDPLQALSLSTPA